MKISGPGPGTGSPPVDETTGSTGTEATERPQGSSFASALAREPEAAVDGAVAGREVAETGATTGPEGATSDPSVRSIDALEDVPDRVAADLRAGRITPEEAVGRLIESVVTHGAAAGVSEATRARLRMALADLVEQDPHLADLVKRLERTR